MYFGLKYYCKPPAIGFICLSGACPCIRFNAEPFSCKETKVLCVLQNVFCLC